jgi:hypothetical protein
MLRLVAFSLLAVAASCGGRANTPALKAFSDADGVLHVQGNGWVGCRQVEVVLPKPWAVSMKRVTRDGRFVLLYPHPEVKPYRGIVSATCRNAVALRAQAEIRVEER